MLVHFQISSLVSYYGHDVPVFRKIVVAEWKEQLGKSSGKVYIGDTGMRKCWLRSEFEPIPDSLLEGWRLEWIALHVELSGSKWATKWNFAVVVMT